MTSPVKFVGAAVEAELSIDARILAEALMRIHGPITVAREKSGLHTAPTVPDPRASIFVHQPIVAGVARQVVQATLRTGAR
jgi:hypothetical protein